jgi:hypothetical protein
MRRLCYPARVRRARALPTPALLVAALVVATACKGPEVPSPLTGQSRHLCCNLYFEKPRINDVGYQVGTKIPFGTRVTIDRVWRREVQFTPEGFPTITLLYRYGEKAVPFETFLDRLLVAENPRGRLKKVPAKRVAAIENGAVEPGMTKEQVLMSRGIPPAHRTPSLDSPVWTYWENRWTTMTVYFDGDKVDRVGP